jgi:drug/metabolite transporter (DMT)-like permease
MLGFIVIIIGSLCLASQNVLLRVIFSESAIMGQMLWGGFLSATVAHSILVLQLRSILILPMMLVLAPRFYPGTRSALQQLIHPSKRSLLWRVIVSSSFLFCALAFLFVAIAFIPAGTATVLFFTHPVITGFLSWKIFGDRPSLLRIVVTGVVLTGSILVVPSTNGLADGGVIVGVAAAFGACITYSIQGILAQTCFSEIHPVPFTVVNFIVMAILSTVCLSVVNIDVPPDAWSAVWGISIVASLLTLTGQLLYNVGIHLISAAIMSIVAVSNPILTTVIAWILLQENLNIRQVVGVLLVVLSIAVLGYEKSQQAKAAES